MEPMPYEERFWRSSNLSPVRVFVPPTGIQGFICALPINWTRGENNDSGLNTTVLANLFDQQDQTVASNNRTIEEQQRT